jgi:hypothetical protein
MALGTKQLLRGAWRIPTRMPVFLYYLRQAINDLSYAKIDYAPEGLCLQSNFRLLRTTQRYDFQFSFLIVRLKPRWAKKASAASSRGETLTTT